MAQCQGMVVFVSSRVPRAEQPCSILGLLSPGGTSWIHIHTIAHRLMQCGWDELFASVVQANVVLCGAAVMYASTCGCLNDCCDVRSLVFLMPLFGHRPSIFGTGPNMIGNTAVCSIAVQPDLSVAAGDKRHLTGWSDNSFLTTQGSLPNVSKRGLCHWQYGSRPCAKALDLFLDLCSLSPRLQQAIAKHFNSHARTSRHGFTTFAFRI